MSQVIFIEKSQSKQWPGLPSLLVDAVVSTAISSYLPNEFRRPIFQMHPRMPKVLKTIRQDIQEELEMRQKRLSEWNCESKADFTAQAKAIGLDRCPLAIRRAADDIFAQEPANTTAWPLAATVAELLQNDGLELQAAATLKNEVVEPFIVKTVEFVFRALQDSSPGAYHERICNEDEGKVTYTAKEGNTGRRGARIIYLHNFIPQIVRDGFGELKDKVKVRLDEDGCHLFWNDCLVTQGSDNVEQLEVFRDAAVWIWLDLLLRHHQAKMREKKSWLTRLTGYKPKGTDLDDSSELESNSTDLESLEDEGDFNNVGGGSDKDVVTETCGEGGSDDNVIESCGAGGSKKNVTDSCGICELEAASSVNQTYLMPEPSGKLAPVVSALRAVGFAQEADKFVKSNRFVRAKAPRKGKKYDLELADGTRPTRFRHRGNPCFWYFTFMEKLRRSKLFTFPSLAQ